MPEMAQNEQDTTESGSAPLGTYIRMGSKQVAKSVKDPLVLLGAVLRTFLPGQRFACCPFASRRWHPPAWGFRATLSPSAEVGTPGGRNQVTGQTTSLLGIRCDWDFWFREVVFIKVGIHHDLFHDDFLARNNRVSE